MGPRARLDLGGIVSAQWRCRHGSYRRTRPSDLGRRRRCRSWSRTSAIATETYTIIPAGLSAAWTTVTRPNVTLFGGSRDVVEVTVRPPAIPSTSSGPTAVAVRVLPQSDPDESTVTETIITVSPFDDRRITVLQPLLRGRRRATYEFTVDNQGNNLASCRLHLVDASRRVDGSFDPPAVGVAPGSSSLVRLKLRSRRSFFRPRRTAGRLRSRSHRTGTRAGHRPRDADPAADDPAARDRPRRAGAGRDGARRRRLVLGGAAGDP